LTTIVPFYHFIEKIQGGKTLKTVEEVITYMEAELAEAYELHDQAKGKDAQEALLQIIRATTITHLLEEIKS
jgi:hypothetical protein